MFVSGTSYHIILTDIQFTYSVKILEKKESISVIYNIAYVNVYS